MNLNGFVSSQLTLLELDGVVCRRRQAVVCSAARKKGKNKAAGSSAAKSTKFSVKGFGRPRPSKSAPQADEASQTQQVEILRTRESDDFYRWMRAGGASIDRVALANFGTGGMRGLMALESISKGECVLSVPRSMSLVLSETGSSPSFAALSLLRGVDAAEENNLVPLVAMLPGMDDASTVTDFFSEGELKALEWEPVVAETRQRIRSLESTLANSGYQADLDRLKWASFNVVSRAFTLRTKLGDTSRCLVPFIDMINHLPGSPHSLAVREGRCEVVAGADIAAGEEICFTYGGGSLNNERCVQDYGFVQRNCANDLGIFIGQGRTLDSADVQETKAKILQQVDERLGAFSTSQAEDDALLESTALTGNMRTATLFRREMKRALSEIQATLER
mmetsp:Transcript_52968/g.129906  ORF Transcript_52968/g.129906 Transcript_52968/m.129906 type:complete len:393 (-) Transcript_52968:71-1249(-)